jgi:GTP-binding protein LepA
MINQIRNFSIIAHIDHGKTTLTDRLLELTGTVNYGGTVRLMDSNPIEVERGITIKLAPVRMLYHDHILNLIDTPGHVDFSYEVSRALHACEGAVLVVDATKGIQAQTIANYDKAKEAGLTIIPFVNKIDMAAAEPERVARELVETLGFKEDEILFGSAKSSIGVAELLDAIVARIPAPAPITPGVLDPLRALVFNSTFDVHKGVIAFVKVISGEINKSNRDNLMLFATKEKLSPLEIGFFSPDMRASDHIEVGEVGYIATGHKDIRAVTIGDTLTTVGSDIIPVAGYQRPQAMVFMDIYPIDASDYRNLVDALGKLALNDASLAYHAASSPALGHGFRVGFLGILHAEIVTERLSREFEVQVVNTAPSVPYKMVLRDGLPAQAGTNLEISSPADWPSPDQIQSIEEPIVTLTIYTPESYVGGIMELTQGKRAEFIDMQYVSGKVRLNYMMPLSELITNFYDRLKSVSSGYASVQYDHAGYAEVDAAKVDILLNGEPAEALSFVSPRHSAESRARVLVDKLSEVIPRSLIEVAIQAAIGGKIIARATVKAFRKDVTAKLHGGDMTRNRKLLDKQKKGKKKMKQLGSVSVPQEAFTEILKI